MIVRRVIFTKEASDDLDWIYRTIAENAGRRVAAAYLNRLEIFCLGLTHGSQRGTARHDVRPGLRVIGFERRISVAFDVDDKTVRIARLFYGGADWNGSF